MNPIERDVPNAGTRILGCSHQFHTECIEQWLVSHSECPLCRTQVPRETNQNTVRTVSMETALNAISFGIQQIMGRYILTLFILSGIFVFEVTDFPYTSTYLTMPLIGINLLSVSLLLPIAKKRVINIARLIKIVELLSSFSLARIVICGIYIVYRIRELQGIDILSFNVLLATFVSNVDDTISISIISPALFELQTSTV